MIVETFLNQLLMKPFRFEEFVCRLAFFTTAMEEKKIKKTFFIVFIVFYNDLLDLSELVFVHLYQGEQAALTVNDQSVDGEASLMLDVIPGKMSNLRPLCLWIPGCPLSIMFCRVENKQVLVRHHTKHREAGASVGQLVVLRRKRNIEK